MKTNFRKALVVLLCIVSFWGCKKDDEPTPVKPDKDPEIPAETVTAKGTPEGTPVSALIGKDGGSLVSADGRIKLEFPAGALATGTNITIQPVSNKMANGIGVAYRFSPEGLQLEKPITLTMNYTEPEVNGTSAEAFGIAYQNASGAWRAQEDVTLNATQKTISRTIKEFKDQALYTKYMLIPGKASLDLNEGIELQVRLVKYRFQTGSTADDAMLIEGEELASASKIKSWKLNGQAGPTSGTAGSLTGSLGAKMSYKAPSAVPAQNPVAVSVEMDGPSGSKIILISNITINGKKWVMDIEWQRLHTCGPGAIASFTYTANARIEFSLDAQAKIMGAKISNGGDEIQDAKLIDVLSCMPDFYSATGEVTGIQITGITGGVNSQSGKLEFALQGEWMDFPTFTLVYKDGSSSVTEESYQTFEGVNMLTKMPLAPGQELNIRNPEQTGFVFKLTPAIE